MLSEFGISERFIFCFRMKCSADQILANVFYPMLHSTLREVENISNPQIAEMSISIKLHLDLFCAFIRSDQRDWN